MQHFDHLELLAHRHAIGVWIAIASGLFVALGAGMFAAFRSGKDPED